MSTAERVRAARPRLDPSLFPAGDHQDNHDHDHHNHHHDHHNHHHDHDHHHHHHHNQTKLAEVTEQ